MLLARAQAQQQQPAPASNMSADLEEQLINLRTDLAQAQQDAETLRAAMSVQESIANVQPADGSIAVAEQTSSQVEAIRAELDMRHNERVQQAEETFKKRADTMRTQLSKKLTEGKESVRQTLGAEHSQFSKISKHIMRKN